MTPSPSDTLASEVPDGQSSRPPFSVRRLADRWSCSEGLIRKMIKNGMVQSFTIGTLIRIPMSEVERIERNGSLAPSGGEQQGDGK